tara:strand:- start:1508 stop:2362 length:855 start_codon:yes stop_codon:yes gene_type:complete
MNKIKTIFLLAINNEKKYGLYEREIEQSIRRLHRVFKTQDLSPELFEESDSIIELILNKYSILTVIQTIKVIIIMSIYYGNISVADEYINQLENIIDMKTNSSMYSKLTNYDINFFINASYEKFMGSKICFSKFRHFLLLALLIKEIPFRFSTLTNIRFYSHNFIDESDCIKEHVYLIRNPEIDSFIFYFNKKKDGKQIKQTKYNITDSKVRMLLKHYFAKYANNLNYLFTTSGGKKCSDSNIANSLSNFCRQYFKTPLTLGEIRSDFSKACFSREKKYIFENF